MKERCKKPTLAQIEQLGFRIGTQTRYMNSYVIEECIKHNMEIGSLNIEVLQKSFLKLPMFVGMK